MQRQREYPPEQQLFFDRFNRPEPDKGAKKPENAFFSIYFIENRKEPLTNTGNQFINRSMSASR